MSKSLDIFVGFDGTMEILAQQIELLLSGPLDYQSDTYESWYEWKNQTVFLTLGKHDLENDRDLNFTDYPYQISIHAINLKTAEERKKVCEDFTQIIWQYLKKQNYNLMLVEDLQVKIDTFVVCVTV